MLTHESLRRQPARVIQLDHKSGVSTIADWGEFCGEAMLICTEGCFERIGGPNKTVETVNSKFGRRKYHRGHAANVQWVFGGVERESGKTFLVSLPDRTAHTPMTVISAWIKPGTAVIRDCSAAYRSLDAHDYTHQIVNHSLAFVDDRTRAQTQ